jgi:hypothetical protein
MLQCSSNPLTSELVVLGRQSEAAMVISSAQRDWYKRFMPAAFSLEKAGLIHLSVG